MAAAPNMCCRHGSTMRFPFVISTFSRQLRHDGTSRHRHSECVWANIHGVSSYEAEMKTPRNFPLPHFVSPTERKAFALPHSAPYCPISRIRITRLFLRTQDLHKREKCRGTHVLEHSKGSFSSRLEGCPRSCFMFAESSAQDSAPRTDRHRVYNDRNIAPWILPTRTGKVLASSITPAYSQRLSYSLTAALD